MRRSARCVVVGGSIAGLPAAVALREAFDEVVIVEDDQLPERTAHRPGVPRGNQVHALLANRRAAMEELLPGLVDDLRRAGGER